MPCCCTAARIGLSLPMAILLYGWVGVSLIVEALEKKGLCLRRGGGGDNLILGTGAAIDGYGVVDKEIEMEKSKMRRG